MNKRIIALGFFVLATLFSFAMADTDQVIFTITVEQNTPDWCNVQFPTDTIVSVGDSTIFYAQVWEDGKTNGEGEFTDINAWIGYSSSNTNPSGSGWTWVPADYNASASSESTNGYANDEYMAEIGVLLSAGTYYVASKFAFEGDTSNVVYGGYKSGAGQEHGLWDGDSVVSAQITVNAVNHAPVLAAITNKSVDEDGSLLFTVSASDSDDDTLTYSIFSNDQSDDISVTISNDTLTIVPNPNFFTSIDANIIVKVIDGHGGEDTTSFKLKINSVNDAPVITAVGTQSVTEGNELTVNFTATDIDHSGASLSWSENGKPVGSVFTDNGDGTAKLVWTPDYTQSGNYEDIEITVDDGVSVAKMVIKTGKNSNR